MDKKIYIIAAEASADLHTSNIIKQLSDLDSNYKFYGWGGPKLINQGMHVTTRYEDVSFMGFYEVIKNINTIRQLFTKTKKEIELFNPDCVLLVDYPGFNLRIAKWIFEKKIPVYYFISPQLWAWKAGRIEILKKYVSKLICILPFEKKYYQDRNYEVEYFGHPLLDAIKQYDLSQNFRSNNNLNCKSIIALFPGSRKQEIEKMLPLFLEASKAFPKFQIVLAGMSHHAATYQKIINKQQSNNIHILYQQNYDILHHARFAMVTSGTATLETALHHVPQVVCYKGNTLSYHIAKKLVKIKYISLVNLIMDHEVVKELIQHECNVSNIIQECNNLNTIQYRSIIKNHYDDLKTKLGNGNSIRQIADYLHHQWSIK